MLGSSLVKNNLTGRRMLRDRLHFWSITEFVICRELTRLPGEAVDMLVRCYEEVLAVAEW